MIGDTPYGAAQFAAFPSDVEAINDLSAASLVVHLGDIKSGSTQCSDSYFAQIRAGFDAFEDPLVYTPGDNEWTDCHRASNGGYLPTERLAQLRDVFFDAPGVTLGENPLEVAAQERYPENVRFRSGGVQFGTLHIVGSNDDLAPWYGDRSVNGQPLPATSQETALRLSEVEARRAANLEWLERIFARARKKHAAAIVIGIQADMWDPAASDLSGFDVYKERLAELAAELAKPVLLLNGDSHEFYADQPLSGAPNLSRITVNGSTSCPHEYLRLRIDVTSESVFSYARVPLPSSEQLCSA